MLVKGYEEVMKETPQERLRKMYTKQENKIETIKPVEGNKCQTKKTTKKSKTKQK
jgi:hypothetical protein